MLHALAPQLFLALAPAPLAHPAPQEYASACSLAVEDAANPGNCVLVSSVPAAGTLLPLGPELFVSPAGDVGVATMAPAHRLDV